MPSSDQRRRTGAATQAAESRPRRPGGASSGVRARRIATWFSRHAQACLGTLGGLARAPVTTALTVAVIGIALALPAGLFAVMANVRSVMEDETGNGAADGATGAASRLAPQLSLYLSQEVDDAGARALAEIVESEVEGATTRVIGREEALAEYRELAGFGVSLEALGGSNPLPAVVVITVQGPAATPDRMAGLLETLDAHPDVEMAQLDLAWMQKLDAMLGLMRRAVLAVAALFALGVVLIVGNTIRLGVERRGEEIEIVRLFGATDAFVRRPFLYAGAIYGLAGGAVALTLVALAWLGLSGPVLRLADLYASGFRLEGLGAGASLAVLGAGVSLGLLGAWVSVSTRLRVLGTG